MAKRKNDKTTVAGKPVQKNVSVYLGHKGEWLDEALGAICVLLNKSESELCRDALFMVMVKYNVCDPQTFKPNAAVLARIKLAAAAEKGRLPSNLDDRLDCKKGDA
jgi:hypothetical protein